jgi:hypothetical protein
VKLQYLSEHPTGLVVAVGLGVYRHHTQCTADHAPPPPIKRPQTSKDQKMLHRLTQNSFLSKAQRLYARDLSAVSGNKKIYAGNGILGIVREDFSIWERRSPLCPHHVTELTKQGLAQVPSYVTIK